MREDYSVAVLNCNRASKEDLQQNILCKLPDAAVYMTAEGNGI